MRSKQDKLRRGVRKSVKWGGAGLTVLLVVVWLGSAWRMAGWRFESGNSLTVMAGKLCMVMPYSDPPPTQGSAFLYEPYPRRLGWWFDWLSQPVFQFFSIPLWFPALLSLLATAAAWRADAKYLRRAREGACAACGYDRAGLAAGSLCPECGKQPEAR